MKKRGFTLIELLAVLVIIALLSGLAMTTIDKKAKQAKQGSFEKLEELYKSAAHSYIISNDELVNTVKAGDEIEISIQFLIDKKYLSNAPVKNPDTNKEIDFETSTITISYLNGKYEYDIVIYDKSVN